MKKKITCAKRSIGNKFFETNIKQESSKSRFRLQKEKKTKPKK